MTTLGTYLTERTPRWPDAACAGLAPLFDETVTNGRVAPTAVARHRVNAAATICRGCPRRVECLTIALDDPWASGVWGGVNLEAGGLVNHWRARLAAIQPAAAS